MFTIMTTNLLDAIAYEVTWTLRDDWLLDLHHEEMGGAYAYPGGDADLDNAHHTIAEAWHAFCDRATHNPFTWHGTGPAWVLEPVTA